MIYLDHHAATPLAPGVVEAMDAARAVAWANPSSVHAAGRAARAVAERARDTLAAALGGRPADVVFTAGGTEACNLAVLGSAAGAHTVVTTEVEHPAVARAVDALAAERGVRVVRLPVVDGRAPDEATVAAALGPGVLLAVQWVNHETGAVLPVAAWCAHARARGAVAVVDAAQALGKLPVDVGALGAHAVAFAAHKAGGPAGAGAVWCARDHRLAPVAHGGAQERGRRPGTPDVVALAGFGAACAALPARLGAMPAVAALRDRLEAALVRLGGVPNGAGGARVATATNASVPGWRGSALVAALDLEGLSAASGAACSSGLDAPSPVVAAMAPEAPWRAAAALRLTLGPETTAAEVEAAEAILARVLPRGGGPAAG